MGNFSKVVQLNRTNWATLQETEVGCRLKLLHSEKYHYKCILIEEKNVSQIFTYQYVNLFYNESSFFDPL
jgi:hypothetical protein